MTDVKQRQTGVRIVKRYSNRKLYDTEESRYVTLAEIAAMVKNGIEVRIIENATKEDITSVTLAQIILEEEKSRGDTQLNVLRKIIQSGGDTISGFLTRKVQPQIVTMREEAEKKINRLARQGGMSVRDGRKIIKGFADSAQKSIDGLQKRLDQRVGSAVASLPTMRSIQGEIAVIQDKIHAIEEKLRKVKKGMKEGRDGF
ncbi:MAG: polyhydroxyalkanoate synthesis regulator DNA-binding domain-containing protein [Deltaproteobacteria bacterium]|nr:polyhydroxyalkanoate synthesis regulator DNA-binding domain-containing protein [Deltaproteobacteria bacterium]